MKVKRIWLFIALIFIGYSGGIITGVVVDVDQVYNTTVKKIKQKKSNGSIVIDVDTNTGEMKSKQEIRQERREAKKEARKNKRKKKSNERQDL